VNDPLHASGVALEPDHLMALRPLALMAATEPALSPLPGGWATRRKGRGQEIADLRDYQPGDDMRHVDPGATARSGRLHVRQFQEERDRVALLVADFRHPMLWGISRAFLSVVAAEALTLIGWRISEEGGRIGLLALTDDDAVAVAPRPRARGMLGVIGALCRAHADALRRRRLTAQTQNARLPPPPLDQSLPRIERICPSGSEVFLASSFDSPGQGLENQLGQLARRRALRLVDIKETLDLPKGRYPIQTGTGQWAQVHIGASVHTTKPSETPLSALLGHRCISLTSAAPPSELARDIVTGWTVTPRPCPAADPNYG